MATVFLMLALGGCGKSETERVEESVRAYLKAFEAGDGNSACGLMSEGARQDVANFGAESGLEGACPVVFAAIVDQAGESTLTTVGSSTIDAIELDGRTAQVRLSGSSESVAWTKNASGWKIAALNFGRETSCGDQWDSETRDTDGDDVPDAADADPDGDGVSQFATSNC